MKLDIIIAPISGFLSPFISTSMLEAAQGSWQGGTRKQCPVAVRRVNARRLVAAAISTLRFSSLKPCAAACSRHVQKSSAKVKWLFCLFEVKYIYIFFVYLTQMSNNGINENVLAITKSANSCCGSSCLR